MNLRHLLPALLVLPLVSPAHAVDDPNAAQAKYNTLKARLDAGDTRLDWRAFRIAAQLAGLNTGFDYTGTHARMQAAFNAGNCAASLKEALAMEDHNQANPLGHIDAFRSYNCLGQTAQRDREQTVVNTLFRSITDSGDGKSAKTAFFTVSPIEEHLYLQLVLGLTQKQEEPTQQKDHAYNRVTALDKTGKETTIWFNADTEKQTIAPLPTPEAQP